MGILDYWAQRKAAKERTLKDLAYWRKESPDEVGMWLAMYFDGQRWHRLFLDVTRPEAPKESTDAWWYHGPISMPPK